MSKEILNKEDFESIRSMQLQGMLDMLEAMANYIGNAKAITYEDYLKFTESEKENE